jgi:hypothetical protein
MRFTQSRRKDGTSIFDTYRINLARPFVGAYLKEKPPAGHEFCNSLARVRPWILCRRRLPVKRA